MKIFRPELFQGSLRKKKYFEGWYYKHVSADLTHVYSFIPGISLNKEDPHAFIQTINGITGESHYISYDVTDFHWEKDHLEIRIGNSVFKMDSISLDIDDKNMKAKGSLTYHDLGRYQGSLLAPGIMGWYSFVPFMECYHGIVSANHFIGGSLLINQTEVNFDLGKGYIEKDWGRSFPECWIWVQSNSFTNPCASLFVSVAKIPWLGKFFIGFIAFLYLDGKYYKFTTYNRSKLLEVKRTKKGLNIQLVNPKYRLTLEVKTNQSGELIAPVLGNMSRRIKESIDSEVSVTLHHKDKGLIFKDYSQRSGLEVIDDIFTYLPGVQN